MAHKTKPHPTSLNGRLIVMDTFYVKLILPRKAYSLIDEESRIFGIVRVSNHHGTNRLAFKETIDNLKNKKWETWPLVQVFLNDSNRNGAHKVASNGDFVIFRDIALVTNYSNDLSNTLVSWTHASNEKCHQMRLRSCIYKPLDKRLINASNDFMSSSHQCGIRSLYEWCWVLWPVLFCMCYSQETKEGHIEHPQLCDERFCVKRACPGACIVETWWQYYWWPYHDTQDSSTICLQIGGVQAKRRGTRNTLSSRHTLSIGCKRRKTASGAIYVSVDRNKIEHALHPLQASQAWWTWILYNECLNLGRKWI